MRILIKTLLVLVVAFIGFSIAAIMNQMGVGTLWWAGILLGTFAACKAIISYKKKEKTTFEIEK